MKKTALALIALCALMMFFVACSDSNSSLSRSDTGGGGSASRNLPAGTLVYFGSQSPGDAWEVTLFTDHTFAAQNKTVTTTSFSGTYSTNANGTLSFVVNKQNGQPLTPNVTVYGTQIDSTAIALLPPGTNNNPIVAYAEGVSQNLDKCSTVSSDHLGVYLPPAGYSLDLHNPAYAVITTTAGAPNYMFSMDVRNLDGSQYEVQGAGQVFTCNSGVLTSAQQSNYAVIAESGAFVVDLGSDGGIAGLQKPSSNIDLAALQGKQFMATYAHTNTRTAVIGGASAVEGTFSMGKFTNPATDTFSSHGTQYTINFANASQGTPGIIQNATVNNQRAIMVANTIAGKLVVLGLTTDQGSTDPLFFTLMEK